MNQPPQRIPGMPLAQGLYLPEYEHDACGVGFVCHIKGKPSNSIVNNALEMLERMNHRGGCGCEPDSGDGAGILVRIHDPFFRKRLEKKGVTLPPFGQYGMATVFLPKDLVSRRHCEAMIEQVVRDYGMTILAWRDVPVDPKYVGPTPRKTEPKIRQVFVGMGATF